MPAFLLLALSILMVFREQQLYGKFYLYSKIQAMKIISTLCLITLAAAYQAQTCTHTILSDNFSSSAGWTMQSTGGAVAVSGGALNFNNAYSGQYNRAYKSLGTSLSDTYWKAESDFVLNNTNPSGNGAGAVPLAITAGTLDFMSYDGSQSYTETSQDGIGVVLFSASATDNNMSNWYFVIEQKKANVRTYSSGQIHASPTVSQYYLRLERTSAAAAQLSIFSDAARTTQLPGSPITFTVNASVTGLNTIQHGAITPGNTPRLLNGSIDNDLVCDNSATTSACNEVVFTDNFSSASNWTAQSASGAVSVTGGVCNFNNAHSAQYNRVYQALPVAVSDSYWKAESDVHINANASGAGAGLVAIALTAGSLDFMGYDASQSYAETTQDGIGAVLSSTSASDNNMNNWFFVIEGKKGNTRLYSSASIYASAAVSDYYLRLERTGSGNTMLSIFSDAARTIHITGSPITYTVNSAITGLNTVQHGAITPGNSPRVFSGTIDNDNICDDLMSTGIIVHGTESAPVLVYPNPFSSSAIIKPGIGLNKPVLKVMDVLGREMTIDAAYSAEGFILQKGSLSAGVYTYYIISENQETLSGKLIVQ